MTEILLSVDVEADGPIPGRHSMLSLGAAAFTLDALTPVATFAANLATLPGATADPATAAFWARNPAAWEATRENPRNPAEAMADYLAFIERLGGRPVFVGYPATYDFTWHHWYLIAFAGRDPCGFSALDLKSYGAAMLGKPFREATKRAFPARWFRGAPKHTHVALDDAIGQGVMAVHMLRERQGLPALG